MKIRDITISNIKSYGMNVKLNFDDDLSIIVGANGAGKSNLMDIINITLNFYFLWNFNENINNLPNGTRAIRYNKQPLDNLFDLKNNYLIPKDIQSIKISLSFSERDKENILIIKKYLMEISNEEKSLSGDPNSEIYNIFAPKINNFNLDELSHDITYEFVGNPLLNQNTNYNGRNQISDLYLEYLHYYEKVKYLIESFNDKHTDSEKITELNYVIKYITTYRFHEGQNFNISLPGQRKIELLRNSKNKSSKLTGTDYSFSLYSLAKIYNDVIYDNYEEKSNFRYEEHNLIKEIKELLKFVGNYDFTIKTLERTQNLYGIEVKKDGNKTDFVYLSSGEKEILNLILSITTMDLRNTVIIIDEPELHLHTQWQLKLISLFKKINELRKIQFIVSTHSPVFINESTIKNVLRIYKKNGFSNVIPESKDEKWENNFNNLSDLVDIISYTRTSKIFFANAIILVEGPSDELIFSLILEQLDIDKKNIEIVNVQGKNNFNKYINFLSLYKIQTFIICDLDNIWNGNLLSKNKNIGVIRSKITDYLKNNKNSLRT